MQVPGKKIFSGEEFFTDWMPRGGDGFVIRGQRIHSSSGAGSLAVKVDVYTKNSEEQTDGTVLVTAALDLTNAGGTTVKQDLFEPFDSDSVQGVEELVRLKVRGVGGTDEWMLVRTFPLIWFDGAQEHSTP